MNIVKVLGLYSQYSSNDIDSYNKAMDDYEEQLKEWEESGEEINRLRGIKKPKKPELLMSDPDYTEIWINFSETTIANFVFDYDDKRECNIVIVEYYPKIGGEIKFLNIKIEKEQWLNLLASIGYNLIEHDTNNYML